MEKCLPWINRLRLSEFSNGNHVEGNHVEDWETANPETSRLLEDYYCHHLPRHSLLKLFGCIAVSITIPWPVAQKEAGTPGEVWGCCSSNWYRESTEPPGLPLLLLNGRHLSNNYLSPSAFGWASFPADWPWRDVQGIAWDLKWIVVSISLLLYSPFFLCTHLFCCLGQALLWVYSC